MADHAVRVEDRQPEPGVVGTESGGQHYCADLLGPEVEVPRRGERARTVGRSDLIDKETRPLPSDGVLDGPHKVVGAGLLGCQAARVGWPLRQV